MGQVARAIAAFSLAGLFCGALSVAVRLLPAERLNQTHVHRSAEPPADSALNAADIAETHEPAGGLPPVPPDLDIHDEDIRGNEVTHAVASYTLDAAGALYEEHSPDTELLDPAPPET